MAQPEKVFRVGLVSASVFRNEITVGEGGRKRTVRSATLQRRYKDGKEWKTGTSFNLTDTLAAIRALELAARYIETKEADVKQ